MYEIIECFPAPECEMGVKVLHVYDRLEDAEVVMAALESVNYNFTCYGIMLRPVWETQMKVPVFDSWDANGSPTI